jgi:hypothetical protein
VPLHLFPGRLQLHDIAGVTSFEISTGIFFISFYKLGHPFPMYMCSLMINVVDKNNFHVLTASVSISMNSTLSFDNVASYRASVVRNDVVTLWTKGKHKTVD